MEELVAHPWYNGPIPSHAEIIEEFKVKRALNEEK